MEWNDGEILRYMGYRGQAPSDEIRRLIGECKQELERVASPRATWREFPLSIRGQEIDMGCLRTRSRSLERNLKDCERVIFFAATLGSEVDVLLHRYTILQVSKAVIMQAASVAMLEGFCDQKNGELLERYRSDGWYLRPRFSPGYGDFPLDCQREIAAALELNKRVGITLTDSLLMAPSKSVTAVIGASRIARHCSLQGCEVCAKKDCPYRR